MSVVRPVAQPSRGVDRHLLGVAEPTHVGRDDPVAIGSSRHQVLKEATCGQIAVNHQHGDAVGGSGLDELHVETLRADGAGVHAGWWVHRSIVILARAYRN